MKRSTRPGRRESAAEADLEAALERARGDSAQELAFFKQLMDAMVYVHAPVSDDSRTPRLVQFRHPDGFDAIPFFTSLGKAEVASSSAVKILGVPGRDLLEGSRGATLMLNPNDGGIVLYPEEIATWLDKGFLARVERLAPAEFVVGPALRAPAWLAPTIARSLEPATFVSSAYLLETHSSGRIEQSSGLLIWLVVDMVFAERAARMVTTAIQPLCGDLNVIIDVAIHDVSQPLPAGLDDPQIMPVFKRITST
ncbi:SseB family protein [Pseudoxanthomonas mexicana]|uniref:SseB family protein n=1 Tax=Pseudoxanthomonas mexicana TaxID=128785 RepID=UPI000785D9CB|nr:SseB family protein [Pseudoxanthomonas mexicana]